MTAQRDIDLSAGIKAIRALDYTAETRSLLRSLVTQGGAKSLIDALVAEGRSAGRDDYEAFTNLQVSLQKLTDAEPITGRILMLYFVPIIEGTYFHDIWDWINIVMWQDRPKEFTACLQEIISKEKDPQMKETFSQWL